MMHLNLTHGLLLILATGLLVPATARSQDFRMETEVFAGKAKEPVVETLTLFSGGVVYDFLLNEPEEITVFDPQRGRFVLLDPSRQLKTTLPTDQLYAFTEAIKSQAEPGDRDFLLHPQFEEQFEPGTGRLTLTSKHLIYQVKGTTPKFAEASRRYQQFADWYARLNAVHPGNMPPFARIELNKVLAEKGQVPEEVQLTLLPKNRLTGKKVELRSRHLIIWDLSQTDRKRIEKVSQYLTSFAPVDLQEYRQIAQGK